MSLDLPVDARLYLEQDMPGVDLHDIAGGTAAVFSVRSPLGQGPNEDAAALIPLDAETSVLAVADGVGGVGGGEQASRLAIEALWGALTEGGRSGTPIRTAILDAIEAANEVVCGLGVGAATTLAAVEIQGDAIRPYHVGDSMVLLVGGGGKVKLQTVAHSPVGFAVESGLLDEEDAMHHADRHIVSNVLGARDMRIEVGSACRLAQRDTLVLASDGLADNLHTAEIIERVRKGPLAAAASALARDAHARMVEEEEGAPSKPDDLTFVVFRRGRVATPGGR